MKDLKKKYGDWALITGASSGIGKEFAKKFAELKINLIITARRKDRLEELANELSKRNKIDVIPVEADLSTDTFMEELKNAIGNREVGILINNAGFGSTGEFSETDPELEANMVRTNCVAPTILTHHFVPKMIERKKGAIIFLGSIVGYLPVPFMSTYSATKVFNIFLGEALWWELKKYNIDVLSLNPGPTDTEFQRIAKSSAGPLPRSAKDVVDTALNNLGKKNSVIDGKLNKLITIFVRIFSRKTVVNLAGKVAVKLNKKDT